MCSEGFRNLKLLIQQEPNLLFSLITIFPNQRSGGFSKV